MTTKSEYERRLIEAVGCAPQCVMGHRPSSRFFYCNECLLTIARAVELVVMEKVEAIRALKR